MLADSSSSVARPEPEFLITGVGGGKTVVRFQKAANGAAAVVDLEREGLREVTLIFDDVIAVSRAIAAREAARLGTSPPPQDPDLVYRRRHAHPTPSQRLVVALDRRQPWIWVPVLLVAILSGWRWWIVVPLVSVCALVIKALAMGPRLMLLHEDTLVALRRNQGEIALELVSRWEKYLDFLGLRQAVGPLEIVALRARALAAAGRQGAAHDTLRTACAEVGAPDWLCSVLAFQVHTQAQEHEQGRDALLRAIEAGPPCATFHFDLALRYAMHLHDVPLAKQHLEQARQLPPSELILLAMPLLEAAILVESGEPAAARERLAQLTNLPPLMQLIMKDDLAVLRAVVAGELGERAEAQRLLRAVEPSLRARHDEYWLERCRLAAYQRGP